MTMESNILEGLELLKQGKTGQNGNIYTVKNAVVYRRLEDRGIWHKVEQILAIKTNSGVILGNSSRMPDLEDKRLKKRIEASTVQRILSEHVPMIPFTVFKEAGLDVLTCEIVDSGPAETLTEKVTEWDSRTMKYWSKEVARHYTGARLFKASPKTIIHSTNELKPGAEWNLEDKYFLCDVDRREIEHGIINFFLAELPEKCGSISEAYDMLKPNEVKVFEGLNNIQVARQGEFFFIPETRFLYPMIESGEPIRRIQVGNSRPNSVEYGYKYKDSFYVRGVIEHTGREHADLELDTNTWFKVVPNTSKANFQLTGDID
jgi:hypothetical protein